MLRGQSSAMFQSMTSDRTVRPRLLDDGSGQVLNPKPIGGNGPVSVHRWEDTVVIVASPGWTPQQWDKAVPADLQALSPGDWDYRLVHGHDVWTLTLQPGEV